MIPVTAAVRAGMLALSCNLLLTSQTAAYFLSRSSAYPRKYNTGCGWTRRHEYNCGRLLSDYYYIDFANLFHIVLLDSAIIPLLDIIVPRPFSRSDD